VHILFLPGGGGAPDFWQPCAALLPLALQKTFLSWPGLGQQPPVSGVASYDDLVALAEQHIHGPTVVVAQSLGCIVAMRLALKHPARIIGLVLSATSGGVDVAHFGTVDWRPAYLQNFPNGARWITEETPDHATALADVSCPALLLWGSADALSPVAIGEHLVSLLPVAKLHVIESGSHYFARERAAEIAPLIVEYLASLPKASRSI